MNKNQKGFAVLESLLILIIIVALGGIGWFVINTKYQTDKTLAQSEKISQSTPVSNKSTQPVSQNSDQPALTIKEWGVKIGLSEKTKNTYYTVDKETNNSNITVYSKNIDEIVGPKGLSCEGEVMAFLLRLPSNDPRWNSTDIATGIGPSFGNRKDIGSYRYAIAIQKQAAPVCWNKGNDDDFQVDEPTVDKFEAIVTQFVKDFDSIQPK